MEDFGEAINGVEIDSPGATPGALPKNPRGRPRKDGKPSGSVSKPVAPASNDKVGAAQAVDGVAAKDGKADEGKAPAVVPAAVAEAWERRRASVRRRRG